MLSDVLAPVLAIVVGYLAGLSKSRRERVEELFTRAFAAVAAQQAARHVPRDVLPTVVPNVTPERLLELQEEMGLNALRGFVAAAESTRGALGAVYPYCKEVRPYWEKFEIAPEEIDRVLDILQRGLHGWGSQGWVRRRFKRKERTRVDPET